MFSLKIKIINIITIIFLFNNVLCPSNKGECADVGYKAVNFDSCKGKSPYDSNNYYCCFLKSGKYQKCVEILKEDVDHGNVKTTVREIEKGIYEHWEEKTIYNKLNTFECDYTILLKSNHLLLFIVIILLI